MGHSVTIHTIQKEGTKKSEQIEGIEVFRFKDIRLFPKLSKITFGKIPSIFSFSAIPSLFKLVKKIQPDVIHSHFLADTGLAAIIVGNTLKIPVITSLLGKDIFDPIDPVPKKWHKNLVWLMKKSSKVVSCSNDQKARAYAMGVSSEIDIIPHGVDIQRFTPQISNEIDFKNKLGIQGPIILSVQRLHSRKGLNYLIDAVPSVLKKIPSAQFIIVGKGPEKTNIENKIENLGIENNVKLVGFVIDSELPMYYAYCNLFVLHSIYEAFGIVLLEAMASEKPVISTTVGGIPEVVQHGKSGILVPPKNATALATAIIKLLSDSKSAEEMGQYGRKLTEIEFNWDIIAKKYLEMYVDLI
jgi:glycosyltransferase involved in cell wall biosynthesis